MGRSKLVRDLGGLAALMALVTAIHLVLLHGVARGETGGTLFAAGEPWAVALVLLMMVARLSALVLLPGYVLCRLVGLLFDWLAQRRCGLEREPQR